MQHGATEFAGNNVKDAVMCLSKTTRFADKILLDGIELSLTYGNAERGSNVDITFSSDDQLVPRHDDSDRFGVGKRHARTVGE
jgi:hypothetical protein